MDEATMLADLESRGATIEWRDSAIWGHRRALWIKMDDMRTLLAADREQAASVHAVFLYLHCNPEEPGLEYLIHRGDTPRRPVPNVVESGQGRSWWGYALDTWTGEAPPALRHESVEQRDHQYHLRPWQHLPGIGYVRS